MIKNIHFLITIFLSGLHPNTKNMNQSKHNKTCQTRWKFKDLTILMNFYHFCYCLHFWTYLVWFRIINYFSFWAPKGLFQSGRNGKQKLKGFKPPSSTWRELAAEVKWYVMIIIVIFAFIYQFILIQITVTNDQYASSI